jgi:hypothetical protein
MTAWRREAHWPAGQCPSSGGQGRTGLDARAMTTDEPAATLL